MHKILIVEDAEDCYQLVKHALGQNIDLVWANSVAKAMDHLNADSFDLVLLDVVLPDGDGFQFCSFMQNNDQFQNIPVIYLTGKSSPNDKVLGFSTGAEDYIQKPFNLMELRARVEAKLRKRDRLKQQESWVRYGDIEIDIASHKARIVSNGATREIDLTSIEFKILYLLLKRPESVLSRDEILDTIWGKGVYICARSVDTYISKLRKKLEPLSPYIQSVHGVGYKISVPKERPLNSLSSSNFRLTSLPLTGP